MLAVIRKSPCMFLFDDIINNHDGIKLRDLGCECNFELPWVLFCSVR